MKTIRLLSTLLIFLMILSLQNAEGQKGDFDYGRVVDNTYKNKFFKFQMDLPEGWTIQSQETLEEMADMGKDLVAGDDENLKAAIEAAEVNVANLLAVFQYEIGASVNYNPSLMIVAENVKLAPGVKTGKEYLFQARSLLLGGQFKYDYVSSDFEKEEIGGQTFYMMDTYMDYMGLDIKQRYYSTIVNKFALNVIISYTTDAQLKILKDKIHSMKFD